MNFESARRDVLAACLELAERGYLPGTGGNVALRCDAEHFAVTPSGIGYNTMRPEDVCVLRLSDLKRVEGSLRPSIEHRLHAYVLRLRRDCGASVHTHQPIASACSLLGRAPTISDPAQKQILGSTVAVVGYAPSGTGWLAAKLRRALRPDINAYLMRNHGALCCAATLSEAVARTAALEAACAEFFSRVIGRRAAEEGDPLPGEARGLLDLKEFSI
ncbi:MAG: class II aldolase/adducin family protein [Terracidiphilus sp.]